MRSMLFVPGDRPDRFAKAEASGAPAPLRLLRKLPFWTGNALEMAKLFLMAPIPSERFQPAVR